MQTQKDRTDDRRVPQTHTQKIHTQTHTPTLPLFSSSPLSLLPAVSHHLFFPSKTPWTYGPLKPAVSLSANTRTLAHIHTLFPIHGVGQQVYWISMISGPASP